MLNRAGTESVDALKSPSVNFLGIDPEKVKNAMSSPSLQLTSESKTKLDMPLSLIVGQEMIKTGLILLAVNPNIGGLVIAGGKGTAKKKLFYHYYSRYSSPYFLSYTFFILRFHF